MTHPDNQGMELVSVLELLKEKYRQAIENDIPFEEVKKIYEQLKAIEKKIESLAANKA